jgi:hypothetical protein
VIWLEAVAAALVGMALLLVVLGPLISREPVPAIVDDEPEDLEETPKGVALSALKEIEFDQATGKLSDEDYAMLKGKYTAQALSALRAGEGALPAAASGAAPVDGVRDLEAVIAARARAVRAEGAGTGLTCPRCGPRPERDAVYCSSCGAGLGERSCGQCRATVAPGSLFCDQCGKRVAA